MKSNKTKKEWWNEFDKKYPTTYSKMDTNMKIDLEFFFLPAIQEEITKAKEEVIEELSEYLQHDESCILSQYSAGRPTSDGGYEVKYDDKWYQSRPVNELPKCDCGFDDFLNNFKSKL